MSHQFTPEGVAENVNFCHPYWGETPLRNGSGGVGAWRASTTG
jgi:hypothetical protein